MASVLWVISADFQRSLAEFDTTTVVGAEGPVRQVEWCGNDAILLTWDTLVLLVGPFGDTLQCVLFWEPLCVPRYFYAGPTFAVTEVDGIRVVAADTCDFIQKVPGNLSFLNSQVLR
jgi:vacuolar protein sorting-associated protein 16